MRKTVYNLLRTVSHRAFEAGKAGWKMDGDKIATDANGNPVYVREDGGEMSVEHNTISRLNAEAKTHREAKEAAEAKLVAYKDLDPAAARTALDQLSKIDQKKLIDAGEVDRVKDEISKSYQTQLAESTTRADQLQSRVDQLTIGLAFKGSKFVDEKVAVPREMFETTFGRNFKVEDGKIVPYDSTGNKIYSKKRAGELADVDEAFELMVDAYPYKDSILKAPGGGGSGNMGAGGNRPGGRTIRRSDFEAMPPAQQAQTAAAMGKGEVSIID